MIRTCKVTWLLLIMRQIFLNCLFYFMVQQFLELHCWTYRFPEKSPSFYIITFLLSASLRWCWAKYGTFICNIFLEHIKIYPNKTITYIFVFDGALHVQFGGELMEFHYTKVTFIREVEHTFYLFFNDVLKTPMVNHMISAHKEIYNLFGSVIYNKPNYIFK